MALQSGISVTPQRHYETGNLTYTLDASGEKIAFIFQCPKTGNIDRVCFRLGTVTTGETLKASLQDVDTTTGYPDEVIDQSGTVAVADVDDSDYKTVTFGSSRAVTRGDWVACVIEFDAAIGNLMISAGGTNRDTYLNYTAAKTPTWAKQTAIPLLRVRYDDGTWPPNKGLEIGSVQSSSFDSGDTPDEIGNIFQVPFPCKVGGAWFIGDTDGDVDIVLYDSDGTSVLASASIDKDVRGGISITQYEVMFSAEVTLVKNTNYRLVMKPTTGTNVRLYRTYVGVGNNYALEMTPMGSNCYWTSRTDAGSWTEDDTNQPKIYPVFTQFDDGVGSGGLLGANKRGGKQT